MDTETVAAAPSAAESIPEIPASGTSEYAEWRVSGNLPEKPKADPAPAPNSETAPAPESGKSTQERRKPDVEARFKKLTDELKTVRAELEEARRPKQTQAESSPARQRVETTRPKPTVEAKNQDGTSKYNTYEDYVEDLADWKAEQRLAQAERERESRKQATELQSKVDDARTRYGEQFDQVLSPTVNRIMGDASVSPVVKAMLNDSEMLPDVIYTLGSNAKDFQEFLKMAPGRQLRYIAAIESGIQAELNKPRDTGGKFTQHEAPAKRGPESTPEPPLDIGQRGGGSLNESQRALQALERGDSNAFRSWKAAEDRKAMARRRGA